MPSRVLLDTNGWLALLNASDSLHTVAQQVWSDLGRARYEVYLTDLVVAETGNGLARTPARRSLRSALESVRASPNARFVFVSAAVFDMAHERPSFRAGRLPLSAADARLRSALAG